MSWKHDRAGNASWPLSSFRTKGFFLVLCYKHQILCLSFDHWTITMMYKLIHNICKSFHWAPPSFLLPIQDFLLYRQYTLNRFLSSPFLAPFISFLLSPSTPLYFSLFLHFTQLLHFTPILHPLLRLHSHPLHCCAMPHSQLSMFLTWHLAFHLPLCLDHSLHLCINKFPHYWPPLDSCPQFVDLIFRFGSFSPA